MCLDGIAEDMVLSMQVSKQLRSACRSQARLRRQRLLLESAEAPPAARKRAADNAALVLFTRITEYRIATAAGLLAEAAANNHREDCGAAEEQRSEEQQPKAHLAAHSI